MIIDKTNIKFYETTQSVNNEAITFSL